MGFRPKTPPRSGPVHPRGPRPTARSENADQTDRTGPDHGPVRSSRTVAMSGRRPAVQQRIFLKASKSSNLHRNLKKFIFDDTCDFIEELLDQSGVPRVISRVRHRPGPMPLAKMFRQADVAASSSQSYFQNLKKKDPSTQNSETLAYPLLLQLASFNGEG